MRTKLLVRMLAAAPASDKSPICKCSLGAPAQGSGGDTPTDLQTRNQVSRKQSELPLGPTSSPA